MLTLQKISHPKTLLTLGLALFVLSGCSQAPTLLPTSTAAPATQVIAPSETPLPSETPMPTNTPLPSPTPTLENWDLAWGDEFNQPDGSPIDETHWIHQVGGGGWGNGERQFYTERIENSFIENPDGQNGVLVLKAMAEDYKKYQYTSARLKTQGTFEQTYGRFEARIQIPYSQGIWPAFWMLSTTGGWPRGGEIDIMENIGKEPTLVHGTIHGPGYSGAHGVGAPYSLPSGEPFTNDYHVYAIEWEPNVIRWYVDNQLYNTITPADLPFGTNWVYDHPFYIIMNVAVGGGWPGSPDKTTVLPQTMKIDYVRVYTRPGGWATSTPTVTNTPKPEVTPTP